MTPLRLPNALTQRRSISRGATWSRPMMMPAFSRVISDGVDNGARCAHCRDRVDRKRAAISSMAGTTYWVASRMSSTDRSAPLRSFARTKANSTSSFGSQKPAAVSWVSGPNTILSVREARVWGGDIHGGLHRSARKSDLVANECFTPGELNFLPSSLDDVRVIDS